MINQSTGRAATLPKSPTKASKLPLLLTARPGNVGVQIDAYRAMSVFKYPRSTQFTSAFHEMMYENGALENYSRVVERTGQRSRLLHERIEKLRAKEPNLEEDEAKRKHRRMQRETARQRRVWRLRQETKQADEQARETCAAITVQRVIRGALARRVARVLRRTHGAAVVLQRAMKMYVSRQQVKRERERRARERDEDRERQLHSAATVLQRQTRKHLKILQEARQLAALTALTEDEENDDDSEDSGDETRSERRGSFDERSADEKMLDEVLRRGISLDLLFSDKGDSSHRTISTSSSSITLTDSIRSLEPVRPQPPPLRFRRNLNVKRVGGGYRLNLLTYDTKPGVIHAPFEEPPESTAAHTIKSSARSIDARTVSSGASSADRRSPRRSPTAVFPTSVAQPPYSINRSTGSTKNTHKGLRSVSPGKGSVSPYAIVQRLLPSR